MQSQCNNKYSKFSRKSTFDQPPQQSQPQQQSRRDGVCSQKHILSQLQKYMFTSKNIQLYVAGNLSDLIVSRAEPRVRPTQTSRPTAHRDQTKPRRPHTDMNSDVMYHPHFKDSLFWCLYIMVNSFGNFEIIPHKNILFEKNCKIAYVEKIRTSKTILKQRKFSTLVHAENQLTNEHCLDIPTFFSLCAIEHINVIYIYKKVCFELWSSDSDDVHILKKIDNVGKTRSSYGCVTVKKSVCAKYTDGMLKIDNISKPLMAISAYKLADLVSMCDTLGIPTTVGVGALDMSSSQTTSNICSIFPVSASNPSVATVATATTKPKHAATRAIKRKTKSCLYSDLVCYF